MKKTLALIAILALVAGSLFAGTPVGSGTLNVYGKIGAGAIEFLVEQTSSTRIDLLGNVNVQPTATGVTIGKWTFTANNQATTVAYTVAYDYRSLTIGNDGVTTPIAIELIEVNGETRTVKADDATTALSVVAGNNTFTRDIAFRLTAAGATAAAAATASENYGTTVTIALSAD
jgi:hypothetical protein